MKKQHQLKLNLENLVVYKWKEGDYLIFVLLCLFLRQLLLSKPPTTLRAVFENYLVSEMALSNVFFLINNPNT
jgi:hypothetical protein